MVLYCVLVSRSGRVKKQKTLELIVLKLGTDCAYLNLYSGFCRFNISIALFGNTHYEVWMKLPLCWVRLIQKLGRIAWQRDFWFFFCSFEFQSDSKMTTSTQIHKFYMQDRVRESYRKYFSCKGCNQGEDVGPISNFFSMILCWIGSELYTIAYLWCYLWFCRTLHWPLTSNIDDFSEALVAPSSTC